MSNVVAENTSDYLIRGSDYLDKHPDFKLEGRDEELKRLGKALTRKNANSVLLVGPGGVGCSSIALGLQASKNDPNAPLDIVGKRFFWLDTDGLFESGDPKKISDSFQNTLKTLSRAPDTVLMIDDMGDFIEGARSNGCSNLINALMRGIKQKQFQAIFEADDTDIEKVLKCHSDMMESYTMLDINQPVGDALNVIIKNAASSLEKHHGIKVTDEAWETAITLTTKYMARDLGLSRAQPERSVTLLDRALTTYRRDAHTHDPRLDALEDRLASVNTVLENPHYDEAQGGKTRAELETLKAALETEVGEVKAEWEEKQKEVKEIYDTLRKAEELVRDVEDRIESQLQSEEEERNRLMQAGEGEQAPEEAESNDRQKSLAALSAKLQKTSFRSDAVDALIEKKDLYEEKADEARKKFDELTKTINDGLELTAEHVLAEFSAISGVPVSKLTQDEKAKLANLEDNLKDRVWGQEDAVSKLANEVLIARSGLQDPDKPQAAFLYLGPSGVGKTWLAKSLAGEVLDDEKALLRFDMSEYQEKHAVAKLIGAPPGYDGYEHGGILTNAMRNNPRRIILFDEIEKAHPDIFLIFLQILDDARLTDNQGRVVSFRDSIIMMTSNTGKKYFIDPNLSFDEAKELALKDLSNKEDGLPPELLNRFNGRENIVCFNRLSLEVIEKIAAREISSLRKKIQSSKPELDIAISEEDLQQMCKDKYEPIEGARGIQGYISGNIKSAIAKTLLFDENANGTMVIEYSTDKGVTVNPPKSLTAEQEAHMAESPDDVRAREEAEASATAAAKKSFSGPAPT